MKEVRHGIGHVADTTDLMSPKFYAFLKLILVGSRMFQRLPLAWLRAVAARIGKGNEKEGVTGERVVMMVCALGKMFYRGVLKRAPKVSIPAWAYGAISKRRMEGRLLCSAVQRGVLRS